MDDTDRLMARIDALEGRLVAHRRLLALMLKNPLPELRSACHDWLEDRSLMRDGEEDPGVLPDGAGLELAQADEMRLILDLLDRDASDVVNANMTR